MDERQENTGTPFTRVPTDADGEIRLPYGVAPISTGALISLRVAGWAVAFIGVLGGAVTLALAPEGVSEVDARFRGIYLSVGWALLIGGIAGGILLNVVVGIGSAVLDMWKSWYGRA